jgi:hypothetical protein
MSIAVTAIERPSLPLIVRAVLCSRWLWCFGAMVVVGLRSWASDPTALGLSLGDTDDATRLTQVRELLAGAPWFDTTLPRFGGATPLVSHWSRLIDLPLALIVSAAGWFLSTPAAELTARVVWPLFLLLVFFRLLVREAEIRVGEIGAVIVLTLSVLCLSGQAQFAIGRIDHHNAMILGAVGGLIVLARALETPNVGWHAGALLGLSLCVGYEALAIIVPGVAFAALMACIVPRWLEGVRNTVTALAVALAVGLVLTVVPTRWLHVTCDALALNMVVLASAGACGLWLLHAYQNQLMLWPRISVMVLVGAVGIGLYGGVEPVCLGGPFAQVDPAVGPIWLDTVHEAQTAFQRGKAMPLPILVFVMACVVGIAAQWVAWRRRPTTDNLFLLVIVSMAFFPAIWQVKLSYYAVWLSTFSLAMSISQLQGNETFSPLTTRLSGVMLTNQATFALLVANLLIATGVGPAAPAQSPVATAMAYVDASSKATAELKTAPVQTAPSGAMGPSGGTEEDSERCRETPSIRTLAGLPRGFFISDVDTGPYIVALTHHDVLAAPYHRIDKAIIAAHRIFIGDAAQGEARLRAVVRAQAPAGLPVYVLLCAPDRARTSTHAASVSKPVTGQTTTRAIAAHEPAKAASAKPETFASSLLSGQPFASLQSVDVNAPRGSFKVWRLIEPTAPKS